MRKRLAKAWCRPRNSGFCAATGGSATVEFAIVGFTFIFMLLAVFELGTYYLRLAVLDLAVQQASRQLMITNSATLPAPTTPTILTAANFSTLILSDSYGLLNGQSLHIAVQANTSKASSGTGFGGIMAKTSLSTATGTTSGNNVIVAYPTSISYGSDVLVQVAYQDNIIKSLMPTGQDQSNGLATRLLNVSATVAFQTEPQNTAQ